MNGVLMKPIYKIIFILLLIFSSNFKAFAKQEVPAVTLGKTHSLPSEALNKTIPLSIHLPKDYASSNKHYPVLYMMGSDYRARFAMFASTMDYMGDKLIPPMILIGVDLPEGNGILLPTATEQDTTIPDGYIHFFENELLPHVANTYRTAPFNVLFGASNSGFFTIYTLLNKPELFSAYLATSPSFHRQLPVMQQQQLKTMLPKAYSENKSLHITYSDDDFDEIVNLLPAFSTTLNAHKPDNLTYKVGQLANQGHVPVMDITLYLLELFPDYNPLEKLDTLNKLRRHFEMLSKRYGYEMHPPISTIFSLGADMIRSKNIAGAEKVFQYSLQAYPDNERSYTGMGVVRREQEKIGEAKVMFEKALTIKPDYSLAKRLLQRLEK